MPKKVKQLVWEVIRGEVPLDHAAWSINTQNSRASAESVAQRRIGHAPPYSSNEIQEMVYQMVLDLYSYSWIRGVKAAALRGSPLVLPEELSLTMKGAQTMLSILGSGQDKAAALPPADMEKLASLPPSPKRSLLVVSVFMMFRRATMAAFSHCHLSLTEKGWAVTIPCEKGWFNKPRWRVVTNIVPPPNVEAHFKYLHKSANVETPFVWSVLQTQRAPTDDNLGDWITAEFRRVSPSFTRARTHSARRTGAQWHLAVHRWGYRPVMYVGGWQTLAALKEYLSDFIGLYEHLNAELGYL